MSDLQTAVMCECIDWCRITPADGGPHHHSRCPKYATEKFPALVYWEPACDAWIPAPDRVEGIIEAGNLAAGDTEEVRFRRADLTDKELAELPEA